MTGPAGREVDEGELALQGPQATSVSSLLMFKSSVVLGRTGATRFAFQKHNMFAL